MAHKFPLPQLASSVAHRPSRAPRHGEWTIEKQVAFLQTLAATQSVSQAARSVGMGRQSAYKLRTRLDNAPFGAAWRMAMQGGRDALIEAALDRAINGVEVPHYWQGERVGTSRRYDERLTALLLNSGALGGARRVVDPAEKPFASADFARLLERIEKGPSQWCDFHDEEDFAFRVGEEAEEVQEQDHDPAEGRERQTHEDYGDSCASDDDAS